MSAESDEIFALNGDNLSEVATELHPVKRLSSLFQPSLYQQDDLHIIVQKPTPPMLDDIEDSEGDDVVGEINKSTSQILSKFSLNNDSPLQDITR